jgi:hypothetical protein
VVGVDLRPLSGGGHRDGRELLGWLVGAASHTDIADRDEMDGFHNAVAEHMALGTVGVIIGPGVVGVDVEVDDLPPLLETVATEPQRAAGPHRARWPADERRTISSSTMPRSRSSAGSAAVSSRHGSCGPLTRSMAAKASGTDQDLPTSASGWQQSQLPARRSARSQGRTLMGLDRLAR